MFEKVGVDPGRVEGAIHLLELRQAEHIFGGAAASAW
jgi:hypothetical protein